MKFIYRHKFLKSSCDAFVKVIKMSDNVASESSWPTWKIALAVGIPVALAGVGFYYYTSRQSKPDEKETAARSEPEGSSYPPKQVQPDNEAKVTSEPPTKTKFQESQELKNEGNRLFKQGKYDEAIKKYSEAIEVCPEKNKTEKSTYHQNMAAALEKLENWEGVVKECSCAVALNQRYVKALHRRSKAFEKLGKKESCLEDITTVCILEGFQNSTTMVYADDILKKIGKEKASEKYKHRHPMMPSSLFIRQYFASFNDDLISIPLSDEQHSHAEHSGYIRARIALSEGKFVDVIPECSSEIESIDQPPEAADSTTNPDLSSYLAEALLMRGTFHLLTGNSALAKPDLDRVVDMKEANVKLRANALIKRGSMNMQLQDTAKAEADFSLAVEIDPENSDVYHHRGQLHILLDKVDAALADFDKCISLKPDFAMAHAQRCYTVYRQAFTNKDRAEIEEAMNKFQTIIDDYPSCSETYGLFAQAQTDGANYEKADKLFQDAIKIEPENATLYVHRGLLALQWKQDLELAVNLITKALEVDEKCDFAHETMGTIEVQRGNLEKATKHFAVSIDYAKSELEMAHLFALQAAAIAQGSIAAKYGLRPPMPGAF
ncbi:mitochondrial import receptor subunit TOM70-like isoform X2 [Clavelina lepadiformis]|uniref:mitochondrial import receptor subunit TOM70-like isoform X2 n=1 Tax=Clavelina lepadiformis TaxID=159417 RepID=UPI00404151A1